MPLVVPAVSQLLAPSGVVVLLTATVKGTGNPELDNKVSDKVGAAPPVRYDTGFSVFSPPCTLRVALFSWINRLMLKVMLVPLVASADSKVTVVLFRPALRVVHADVTENVMLTPVVLLTGLVGGVTLIHGTLSGLIEKGAEPVSTDRLLVAEKVMPEPLEVQV